MGNPEPCACYSILTFSFGGFPTTASCQNARQLIADPDKCVVSSASAWEISIKSSRRRLEIDLDDLEDTILKNGFRPVPIELRHALTARRLPHLHRDPFERMLVAQAIVEELPVSLTTACSSVTRSRCGIAADHSLSHSSNFAP